MPIRSQDHATPKPSLALLGFTQRKITAPRVPDVGGVCNRKAFPTAPQTFGDWVRVLRTSKGFSQRQLATGAGLPLRRLGLIEANAVISRPDELLKIERALGIDATSSEEVTQQ